MISKLKKQLAKREGAALVTVMIMFTVIMIITASAMTLFSSNLKQTQYQEQKTQAYYIAMSGIDLGLSALFQETPTGDTLLDDFKWDKAAYADIITDLSYRQTVVSPLIDTITIDGNTVQLTISAINTSGKREVELKAVGTHIESGTTYSLALVLDPENPIKQRWK